MGLNKFLEDQGWELVRRQNWIAVLDHRDEFKKAFGTNRVGKIVDTNFYVTLSQLPEVAKGLVRQIGCDPVSIKSTSGQRDVDYWGLALRDVPEERLSAFVTRLADAINELL